MQLLDGAMLVGYLWNMPSSFSRVLVGASGSASVTGLVPYLTALQRDVPADVTVVMTRSARLFIPEQTVALHADRVVTGDDPTRWATENQAALALSHDLLLILPASANMLSVAATGAAPNLLGGVILAAIAPIVFFPVMSPTMLATRAVTRNIEQLRSDGHTVIDPEWTDRYDPTSRTTSPAPTLPSPGIIVDHARRALERD